MMAIKNCTGVSQQGIRKPLKKSAQARAMVYWLRQTARDQEVVGSNPDTVYWMDENNENNQRSRMGHTKIKKTAKE